MKNQSSLLILLLASSTSALQQQPLSRRAWLATGGPVAAAAAAIVATTTPDASLALDMDAFASSQISSTESCNEAVDKRCAPKLTEDQALCKYGYPSKTTGEACVRAGMSTTDRPGELDAFGNIPRGDFVRCKTFYEDTGTKYEKKTVCK